MYTQYTLDVFHMELYIHTVVMSHNIKATPQNTVLPGQKGSPSTMSPTWRNGLKSPEQSKGVTRPTYTSHSHAKATKAQTRRHNRRSNRKRRTGLYRHKSGHKLPGNKNRSGIHHTTLIKRSLQHIKEPQSKARQALPHRQPGLTRPGLQRLDTSLREEYSLMSSSHVTAKSRKQPKQHHN